MFIELTLNPWGGGLDVVVRYKLWCIFSSILPSCRAQDASKPSWVIQKYREKIEGKLKLMLLLLSFLGYFCWYFETEILWSRPSICIFHLGLLHWNNTSHWSSYTTNHSLESLYCKPIKMWSKNNTSHWSLSNNFKEMAANIIKTTKKLDKNWIF